MFRRPPLHYPGTPVAPLPAGRGRPSPGEDRAALRRRRLHLPGARQHRQLVRERPARTRLRPRHASGARGHEPARVDHRPARRQPGRGRGRASEPELEGVGVRARVRVDRARRRDGRRRDRRGARRKPARPRTASASTPTRLPGGLSFWDLVFGTPGRRPAALPRRRARRRLRVPVQLGDDGSAEGGAPHAPVARRRGHQLELGVRGASRGPLQFFLPLFHIYGIAITGCTWVSAATLRCSRASTSTGCCRTSRTTRVTLAFGAAPIAVAMANHPELEKLRPLVAPLHDVGGHADRRGRRQPRHRTHGHPLARRVRRHRGSRPALQPGRLPGSVRASTPRVCRSPTSRCASSTSRPTRTSRRAPKVRSSSAART